MINATGVVIHTNLGRAPLSDAAIEAMRDAAHYSNLEFDLATGARGSRAGHLDQLLRALTGAEAAVVVNNNAAALYLALSAHAQGRGVIVSRGQAVEIGGGFRIPDVLRQSGATLVEVGTTNRTRAADYRNALDDQTAALLRVHTSNFRVIGFTEEAPLDALREVADEGGALLIDDIGSGCLLETRDYGLSHEPQPQESVAAGSDLVLFSGDKLLGGPQCRDHRRPRSRRRSAALASLDARPATRQNDDRRAGRHPAALPARRGRDAHPRLEDDRGRARRAARAGRIVAREPRLRLGRQRPIADRRRLAARRHSSHLRAEAATSRTGGDTTEGQPADRRARGR